MKNILLKTLFIVVVCLVLSSCKKSKDAVIIEPEVVLPQTVIPQDPLLLKVTKRVGDMATIMEFTYDALKKLKTVKSNDADLTVTYGANGKVSLMKGLNASNKDVSYTLEYNSSGQLVKTTYVNINPSDIGYVKTYEYNANGKVIKTTKVNKVAISGVINEVVTYIWAGNNISSTTLKDGLKEITYNYKNYDVKVNPFSLADGIAALLIGQEASNNNYYDLEEIIVGCCFTSTISVFTFAANSYPTSFYLAVSTPNGYKFFYDK